MKYAAIFPGQGSQQVGMGQFLFNEFSLVRELFEEASDALKIDFKKLCFEGPESDLALTENTQPCLLLVSTASYKTLESLAGFQPSAAAGHSIGEYAAMVCSGAMGFADAMQAVRKRGEFMQSAVPVGEGGMIATMGLTPEQVSEVCEWAKTHSQLEGVIEAANFNAPGQIVLSGNQNILDWVHTNFKAEVLKSPPRRSKFIPLKVSAPFHCSLMKPAEDRMRPVLEQIEFQTPSYPIFQNVSAQAVTEVPDLRENLIQQISSSVRWVECTQAIVNSDIHHAMECGTGQVLAGLSKKICGDQLKVWGLNTIDQLKEVEAFLNQSH